MTDLGAIEKEFESALSEGVFPGAAVLVARRQEILYRGFFGKTALENAQPVGESTLFDIASLTKPVATASLAVAAIREKGLSLNAALSRYLKEFSDENKRRITIRHLLKHTSGLPAWRPYFEEIARDHPEVVGKRESRPHYLARIAHEPLETPVAYQRIYSDLGYIILGIFLEEYLEAPLDELFATKIAGPLEMGNTFYRPIGEPPPAEKVFAATEDSSWRKRVISGEVHDDNAYALGGVAGHAGLFSTVDDLHRFLTTWDKGFREGHPLFPFDHAQEFVGPKVKVKLGWDTVSPQNSQAGSRFSKLSIGHLGYSGCSFWMDLEKGFHVILLTNRVCPSSRNEKIKEFRPKIHDFLYEHLIKE